MLCLCIIWMACYVYSHIKCDFASLCVFPCDASFECLCGKCCKGAFPRYDLHYVFARDMLLGVLLFACAMRLCVFMCLWVVLCLCDELLPTPVNLGEFHGSECMDGAPLCLREMCFCVFYMTCCYVLPCGLCCTCLQQGIDIGGLISSISSAFTVAYELVRLIWLSTTHLSHIITFATVTLA